MKAAANQDEHLRRKTGFNVHALAYKECVTLKGRCEAVQEHLQLDNSQMTTSTFKTADQLKICCYLPKSWRKLLSGVSSPHNN